MRQSNIAHNTYRGRVPAGLSLLVYNNSSRTVSIETHTTCNKSFQWRLHEEKQCFSLPRLTILSQQINAIICSSNASYNLHLLHNDASLERCNFLLIPYKQSIPLEFCLLKPVNGALTGMATSISGSASFNY